MTGHVVDTRASRTPEPEADVAAPRTSTKPEPGRRRRRGPVALEREADQAAEALLAGAAGLASRLTPTRAAGLVSTGSLGRPLPQAARERLERGFGADLGQVRLHDDATAHRIADAEGARAFAAGADVYFGSIGFDPGTTEGFRLLAHEVAHVLQQTGRASYAGRRRATDARGDGEIQAEDRFLDRFVGATPDEIFSVVTDDHGGTGPESPVARLHDALARRLRARIDPASDEFRALLTDALSGSHDATTVQERSYLLDVLKAGEAWEAAASLIESSPEQLATYARSSTFDTWLWADAGRPIGWPAAIVNDMPALRTYRDLVYGAFRVFLVRPDQRPYTIDDAAADRMVARPEWATTPLVPNERVWLAAYRLLAIEVARFQMCREADEWSGSALISEDEREREFSANAVFRGTRRALRLQPRLEAWNAAARADREPLLERAGTWFEERRARAQEFWTTSVEAWTRAHAARLGTGRGELTEEVRAQLIRSLGANPVAQAAARRVSAACITLLDAHHADLPPATQYAARVDAFRAALEREIRVLMGDLSRFRLDESTRARADLVPWLVLRLEMLRQAAKYYRAAEDTSRYDDTRHGHRLLMSTEMRRLAVELDDMDLEEAAIAVQHNEAGGATRLVLISDWAPAPDTDVGKLLEDFPDGIRFAGNVIFDSRAIAAFYREAYLRRLADSIELLLDPMLAPGASDVLVLQQSVAAARQAPQAVRWRVEESDWAPHPDETRTVAEIIRQHSKSVDQLPDEDRDTTIAYPGMDAVASLAATPRLTGVFVWELPAWDLLASEAAAALSEIPFLRDQLGAVGGDPLAWLTRADRLIGAEGGPTREVVKLRIWRHLHERQQAQRRRLGTEDLAPGLLRRATNHDRVVVAARVASQLEQYDGRIGTWARPVRALELMERFHAYALPATDNLPQTAALVVDVAAALRTAFVREVFWGTAVIEEDRYDLITGYYGFLLIAQRWLRDPDRRRRLATDFGVTDERLTAGHADLAATRASFDRVRARIQTSRGFESTAGGGLRSLNYPFVVTTEHQFGWNGEIAFELVRVFRQFRFHPKYGEPGAEPGADVEHIQSRSRGYSEARVVDVATGVPLPAATELLEVRVNDRPTIVRAGDLELLDTMWRAVEDKAFQLSMENLAAVIEGSLTLALDLAELVPGAGQALAVGRIVVSVATFLASADFEDIKAVVSGELIEQVEDTVENLGALLTPDQIWLFLLFDFDPGLLQRLRGRGADSPRARRVRRRQGRLGRLLRTLLSVGTLIGRQVERVRERIQPPLRTTQTFVVTHPVVNAAINAAADAVAMGPDAVARFEQIAEFATDAEQLSQRMDALLGAIEEFELPEEIIPFDVMVGAILSLILDRFGTKGKLLRRALEATGAMGEIQALVADALPDLANPNRIWVEQLRPLVDDILTSARRDLLNGVYGALEGIGLTDIARPADRRVTATLTPSPEDDAEAAPAITPGHALDRWQPPDGDLIPRAPGSPLPARARVAAEAAYGRSFEHVRLHRHPLGPGVDALTRGSHVVMRPGLSLEAVRGAHVLRHELAHVVQRAGGAPGTAIPASRGRAGTRIRLDPAAEAEADRMASGQAAPGLAPRRGSDDAAAPALSDEVLSRVLKRLADYSDLREFQEDIHAPTTTLPVLTAEQARVIDGLKQKLVDVLRASNLRVAGIPPGTGAYHDTEALVRHHARLAGDKVRDLANSSPDGVHRLAQRALDEDRPPQGQSSSTVQARRFHVMPSRLAALLEGYLLVRTGLLVDVDLPAAPATFEGQMLGSGELDLRVTGLFLGAITRSSRIWEPILQGQLAVGRTVTGAAVSGGGAPNRYEISDAAKQTALYQAIVSRLRAIGPRNRVLKATRFELVDELVEQAVDRLAIGVDIQPGQLPRPDLYLDTRVGGAGADIGLRVATHGRLTGAGAVDRDSHHTTQYLFVEYLSHLATPKPFADREPGLEYRASRPHVLHRADGGTRIRIGDLHGTGRGDPMPAVLVSRPTHQRGELHVNRSAPLHADDTGGTSNQASTVHNWFRDKAPANPSEESLAAPGTTPSGVGTMAEPAKVRNRQLVEGVENVYVHMRRVMLAALERALVEHEKPYYETIAARRADALDEHGDLKSDWQLHEDQLRRVFAVARENNDDVLTGYGVVRRP